MSDKEIVHGDLRITLLDNGAIAIHNNDNAMITIGAIPDGSIYVSAGQRATEIGIQTVNVRENGKGHYCGINVKRN